MRPFTCHNAGCGDGDARTLLGYVRRDGSLVLLPMIADPKRGTRPGAIIVTCCVCGTERAYVGPWQRFAANVRVIDVTNVKL